MRPPIEPLWGRTLDPTQKVRKSRPEVLCPSSSGRRSWITVPAQRFGTGEKYRPVSPGHTATDSEEVRGVTVGVSHHRTVVDRPVRGRGFGWTVRGAVTQVGFTVVGSETGVQPYLIDLDPLCKVGARTSREATISVVSVVSHKKMGQSAHTGHAQDEEFRGVNEKSNLGMCGSLQ